jgi:hypothetical protein
MARVMTRKSLSGDEAAHCGNTYEPLLTINPGSPVSRLNSSSIDVILLPKK